MRGPQGGSPYLREVSGETAYDKYVAHLPPRPSPTSPS